MKRSSWTRAAAMLAACVLCAGAMQGSDREFSDVVEAIGDTLHAQPTRIPFFGLVNLVTAAKHPGGTKHIDLAIFEHLNGYGRDLPEKIRAAVGTDWKPFVQVRSEGDTVFVYAKQIDADWKLLVVTLDSGEATVVELVLNADALSRWVKNPAHHARHWDENGDAE